MEMMTLDEGLTNLMKEEWKISEEDIKRVRPELAIFFEVMKSPKLKEIGIETFTPNDEEAWAVRRAVSRKIYLTFVWFRAREIIAAVIVLAIALWVLLPIDIIGAIFCAPTFAVMVYFMVYVSRPIWVRRLYHDLGMYWQSSWAEAVYGEIEPLSIGQRGVRVRPAWITRFID